MEETFDLLYNDQTVGTVCRKREGLYFCFRCQCYLPDEHVYYVALKCENKLYKLGICVPSENGYTMQARVRIKNFAEAPMTFTLLRKDSTADRLFVSIEENQPFAYIDKLYSAYMVFSDGRQGICIEKH